MKKLKKLIVLCACCLSFAGLTACSNAADTARNVGDDVSRGVSEGVSDMTRDRNNTVTDYDY